MTAEAAYKEAQKRIEKARKTRATELELIRLGLKEVPPTIGQLSSLRELYVNNNQLASLPDSLGQLSSLQELYLSDNQLDSLPDSLGKLSSLQRLYLHNNQLDSLPDSIQNLTKLKVLTLHRNPALKLPESVLGTLSWNPDRAANPADILTYYFETRLAARPLLEAKLILVGRGGVGKSSLVDRLAHDKFDPKKKQTDGIAITEWQVKLNRKETARLTIWDFGGQEIMHSTHQFFLTERSLYLVVLNGREGLGNEDAEYWLRLVSSFGKGAPAIVVLNKIKTTPFDLDERSLRERYPFICAFIKTDCNGKVPPGIEELTETIRQELDALDGIRASFPESWFSIKDRLAEMTQHGENYLSPDKYQAICEEHGEHDAVKQKQLAGFLHQLGTALNYADDERLLHAHVLNPHWVTDGIYKILTSKTLQEAHGDLHAAHLHRILPPKDYPKPMRQYLCELMRRFELAFIYPEDGERYLVPQLLSIQTPVEADQFDRGTALEFEYKYPVIMPEGLIPRFIVRTHSWSEGLPRWRSGVMLEMGDSRALVRGYPSERRIRISVTGSENDRQGLLDAIRYDFEHVHGDVKGLEVDEQLLPALADIPLSHEQLLAFEKAGVTEYPLLVGGNVIRISVKDTLDRFDPVGFRHTPRESIDSERLPELFISYAHDDERYLNHLRNHLEIFNRRRLVSTWYDREIKPGADWNRAIEDHLRSSDVILLIVSTAFLASDYIDGKELAVAIERSDAGEATVIPIILEECLWEDNKDLAKLEALPKDAEGIRDWKPQRKGWFNAAKGIKTILMDMKDKRARAAGAT